MVEFGPKPSESSNLHEGEGLSLAHWELLAKTRFKDPKVNRFAQAVIEGQIEGASEIYRQYLGNRHWNHIEDSLDRKVKGVRGTILGFRNRELLESTQQLAKYANREQEFAYTLDDHFSDVLYRVGFLGDSFRWSRTTWGTIVSDVIGADTNGQGGTPVHSSVPMLNINLDMILPEFLLTIGDVSVEASFKGPQQLIDHAKSIDVKILNDRLTKKVRNSDNYWLEFKPKTHSFRSDIYRFMYELEAARRKKPVFQRLGNWEKEI